MDAEALLKLNTLFADALGRCEHCGKEGNVYDCDECAGARTAWVDAMTDFLCSVVPDASVRTLAAIMTMGPVLKGGPVPE